MIGLRVPDSLTNDLSFYKYLRSLLIEKVKLKVLKSDYSLMNKGLNEIFNIDKDCKSILIYYVNKFEIVHISEDRTILIGDRYSTEYLSGTNIKFNEIVRMIEYGTEKYPPIPCITKVINKLQNDISDIYKHYIELRS